MKFGKGTVKKYSREYNRTLKNGEKKNYKEVIVPEAKEILYEGTEKLIKKNLELTK